MPNQVDLDIWQLNGERGLLDSARRMLLISRTPVNPAPAEIWLQLLKKAVGDSNAASETLVTGFGRLPYDLALRKARHDRVPAIVVLAPNQNPEDPLLVELLPSAHLLVIPLVKFRCDKKAALSLRDRQIAALSDRAWEISVRPGGLMEQLKNELLQMGFPIETPENCEVPRPRSKIREKQLPIKDPATILARDSDFHSWMTPNLYWHWFTHYTRAPKGAFHDEPYPDYLDWLLTESREEPRTGFDTLIRILEQDQLKPSGLLMPQRKPMLSFTILPPWQMQTIMYWRKGLARWNFSPYGIAIDRLYLFEKGVRPVDYLNEMQLKNLPEEKRKFAQPKASDTLDWSSEFEWRMDRTIRLSRLKHSKVCVLTATVAEAALVESRYGYNVLPICE